MGMARVSAMETLMFPLKLDVLLVSLERAAAAIIQPNARRLTNSERDPREIQRMEDELRLAREQVRMQITRGRLLW
jgi:hypothetical protein